MSYPPPPPAGFNPPPGPPDYTGMSYPSYGFGGGQQPGGYPAYPPAPGAGAPYPPAGGAPGYPPAPGGYPAYPSAAGSSPYPNQPGMNPYPPAPGGYPPAPGSSPYPPAHGSSPYPPAPGNSPYPPAPGMSPYPSAPGAGSSPYPPAPGGYPPQQQQGGYAAPPGMGQQGGYAAPPGMGGTTYPPAGGNQYPPAGGSAYPTLPTGDANTGRTSPYPGGAPMGGRTSPYPGGAPASAPSSGGGYTTNSAAETTPSVPQLIQYTEIPTIKPMASFDPSSDAAILRKAMKGLGTDEAAIIGVLAHRTSVQRQEIMLKFQQGFGRDLIKDLKSELSGKFEQVIIGLMTPLPVYLARELHHAMDGIGTNERALVEILCTNSNAWIMAIKNAYYQEFKRKLEDDIKGDTGGDFKRVLISMCAACRDENTCDTALANSLAQQLYKAGEGRLGTNEGEFNRILATYSFPLLRCVFDEYKKINGRTFGQAIDSEFSGDIKTGFKAIYLAIENRAAFFAKEIHDSMAGMGTNDRALIRMVVSRSEIDMGNIKEEYQRMYGKPLEKDIKGDISGDYKRCILALVNGS